MKKFAFLRKMRFALPVLALGLSASTLAETSPEAAIPSPPTYYVLDEPHLLGDKTTRTIQAILIEHDRLTGQQIMLAIFSSLSSLPPTHAGADKSPTLEIQTQRVFDSWKIGQRGQDNGALLAIFWKERKARIQAGSGLDALLPESRCSEIITDFWRPELRSGTPDRAISLTLFQVLSALQSPLIESGRADTLFRAGGFQGDWAEITPAPWAYGWIAFLTLGGALLLFAASVVTAADAHFTRDGWFRPRPWGGKRIWREGSRRAFTGGGIHAEW